MAEPRHDQIVGRVAADRFVGRHDDLARLIDHARGNDDNNAVAVLAEPFSGSGELLRQAYDRLFKEGGETIPFFFDVRNFRGDLSSVAVAFVRSLAVQIVAFGRRDPSFLHIPRDLMSLADHAAPKDLEIVTSLSEIERNGCDDVQSCFAAPLLAAAGGRRLAVFVAGAELLAGTESSPLDLLGTGYRDPRVRLVLAGDRRAIYGKTSFQTMELSSLGDSDASEMAAAIASSRDLKIADHICDLIGEMFTGSPALISAFLRGVPVGGEMTTYGDLAREYADSVCGGELSLVIDEAVRMAVPDIELRARTISILCAHLDVSDGFVPISFWQRHLKASPDEAARIVDALNCAEFIDLSYAGTRIRQEKVFLTDHLWTVRKLSRSAPQRALIISELVSDVAARSPEMLERAYRRRKALGVRSILESFASQAVSTALLDFRRFRNELRGADPDKIEKALKEDTQKLMLPAVSFAANTAYFYPQFAELCDLERSAVGVGTANGGSERAVWLAAEIESKLEADAETTEFWCDRLEMAAANSGFEHFTIWLIAPEGFSEEALDVLDKRYAFGSSRRQVEMLRSTLASNTNAPKPRPANEYEITIPTGEETEVAAVHAFEEAARRFNIPQKTINQIKTALVEACINASEHSNSPDGKIELRFAFLPERVDIEVLNRGVRMTREKADAAAAESRRGWGLKLMKGLMDDVSIESGEGRTTVRLSKHISAE
ncbi:MAG: ATP-binding protein [Acidobacteria bacterium]|nr:ATP-binding protein [Acidobacteriota bacterium]